MAAARAYQVAALPWRRRGGAIEILLITSRETRRWVIPKGWPMTNLIDSNAAKREAYEEAGVDGRVQRHSIGRYSYRKRSADGSSRACVVTVYALNVVRQYRAWPERHERRRAWVRPTEAEKLIEEAKLRQIIHAFAAP
jgi:8-oxo-dGTP pyrophosphatase MutT (NUDIX family)